MHEELSYLSHNMAIYKELGYCARRALSFLTKGPLRFLILSKFLTRRGALRFFIRGAPELLTMRSPEIHHTNGYPRFRTGGGRALRFLTRKELDACMLR